MKILQSFFWRLIRTASSIGVAAAVMWVTKDPKFIWVAPIVSATAKVLRDKFGLTNIPF